MKAGVGRSRLRRALFTEKARMIGRDHTAFAEPLAHPGEHLRKTSCPTTA